eukprot:5251676-Amphidinium_carterae.1
MLPSTSGGVQPRMHCPLPWGQHHHEERVQGWTMLNGTRAHLNLHACGQLESPIPPQWLEGNALGQCCVCTKVLHRRFMPACPLCRPSLVQALPSSRIAQSVARPILGTSQETFLASHAVPSAVPFVCFRAESPAMSGSTFSSL